MEKYRQVTDIEWMEYVNPFDSLQKFPELSGVLPGCHSLRTTGIYNHKK